MDMPPLQDVANIDAVFGQNNNELCRSEEGAWMVRLPELHNKPTVTSLHRSVYVPSQGPRDSLDIHLSSCYSHNLELFPDTSDVMIHPSRLPASHRQHMISTSSHDMPLQNITYGGLKDRPSIHSVKLGISANHSAQTNAGFSRKLDGTFYSL